MDPSCLEGGNLNPEGGYVSEIRPVPELRRLASIWADPLIQYIREEQDHRAE